MFHDYRMKCKFIPDFFLSHDNSEKYQYFMHKVCILRKFCAKIAPKRSAFHGVIMLLLMPSLARCKKCYVTCDLLNNLRIGFMKGRIM